MFQIHVFCSSTANTFNWERHQLFIADHKLFRFLQRLQLIHSLILVSDCLLSRLLICVYERVTVTVVFGRTRRGRSYLTVDGECVVRLATTVYDTSTRFIGFVYAVAACAVFMLFISSGGCVCVWRVCGCSCARRVRSDGARRRQSSSERRGVTALSPRRAHSAIPITLYTGNFSKQFLCVIEVCAPLSYRITYAAAL